MGWYEFCFGKRDLATVSSVVTLTETEAPLPGHWSGHLNYSQGACKERDRRTWKTVLGSSLCCSARESFVLPRASLGPEPIMPPKPWGRKIVYFLSSVCWTNCFPWLCRNANHFLKYIFLIWTCQGAIKTTRLVSRVQWSLGLVFPGGQPFLSGKPPVLHLPPVKIICSAVWYIKNSLSKHRVFYNWLSGKTNTFWSFNFIDLHLQKGIPGIPPPPGRRHRRFILASSWGLWNVKLSVLSFQAQRYSAYTSLFLHYKVALQK